MRSGCNQEANSHLAAAAGLLNFTFLAFIFSILNYNGSINEKRPSGHRMGFVLTKEDVCSVHVREERAHGFPLSDWMQVLFPTRGR